MKKSIFLFFAAILCATSAWGYDMNSAEIYYDNTASQWPDVQLFVGKSDWNSINPMKKISNTNNLYYLYDFSWGGYSAFYFTTGTASWDPLANNENVDSRSNWATCRSAKQTTSLNSTVNLYISTAATKGAAVTRKTLTDYKSLNYKQTVQQQLTTDGSTYSASTEAIATIKVASYRLASATATSATAQNGTIASGSSSANCEAARTATVTYSVSGINSSYSFVGWYDGDTQKSTSATYTYQATEAKTITARFAVATEEEHEVAVSYMCGTTKVADGATAYVGVETEKSFTAPTNITGYKFTNWTIGAGMTLKTGAATDATIGVVTKSASSDYTLVANYEEVLETVYFINTINWARVNIHKWNGKAAASSWPGEKLTASGEKIGDYDVYAYTAKQGDYANIIFNSKTSGTDSGNAQTDDLDWIAGKYYIHNYNGNKGWYTKEDAEALLVAPVVEETVYFVNNKKWTKVQAYAWNATGNNGWPGATLTTTGEKVAGFDVYSYTAPQGYANVIFNNKTGDSGEQSADFVWTNGKYYYMGAAANYPGGTEEDVATALATPVPTYDYYIAGPLAGGWNATQMGMEKVAEGQYTCEFTKDAGDYQFKVTNGKWGNETGGFDCADVEGSYEEVSHVDGNVNVKLTSTTTFTVKFDSNTKKISFEGLTTATPAPTYDYYIAGPLAGGWSATQMGLEKVAEGQYTCEFTKDAGDYQFKVTNGKWGNETGGFDCADVEGSYEEVSHVDGNVNVKLTATTTFTVKFDSNTKKISFEGLTPAETKYYIAGTENLTGFDWQVDGLEMTEDAGVYKHTFSALPAGTFEFKVTQGDWNKESWGYYQLGAAYEEVSEGTDGEGNPNGNIKFVTEEAKNITVIFDPAAGKLTIGGLTEKAPVVSTYALMGVGGDWTTGITMTVNPDNADEYVLKAQSISSTDAIKVLETAGSTQTWHNTVDAYSNATFELVDDGFGGKNIVLPEGTYNFYFKKINNEIYIEEVYVRDVTNTYGTICLPYASNSYDGAIFYRVAGKETGKVYLESVSELEAGVPYIFEKTASKIVVARNGAPVANAGSANGLVGTFTNETEVAAGNYILYNNQLRPSDGTAKVNANRAYLKLDAVTGGQPTQMPGRRYIGMSVQGENEATGFENITAPEGQAIKVIENGQLIIIRGNEKFNAQGVRL